VEKKQEKSPEKPLGPSEVFKENYMYSFLSA